QNKLGLTEKINFGVQAVTDNLIDTLVNPSASNEAIPTGTVCPGIYERNSDYLTLRLLDQIAQPATSLPLSASLKFVHDVQPYQNIQHDTNMSDDFIDRKRSPYVMRIQGIKTQADKGKSILPRIQVRFQTTTICSKYKIYFHHSPPLYSLNDKIASPKVDQHLLNPLDSSLKHQHNLVL
ncbi:unnamed protein product, partial [Rotaria magnacalcarata]